MKNKQYKKFLKQKFISKKLFVLMEDKNRPRSLLYSRTFNSEPIDIDRINLKKCQRSRNKPSMPQMPWDKDNG